MPSIESSDEYPLFNDWIKIDENALLNTTSLEGTAICDTMPDFRNPLPFDGDGAPGATLPGVFPSIFGKSTDGVVFLYDRHLTFYENSVENMVSFIETPCLFFDHKLIHNLCALFGLTFPFSQLPDGGGSLAINTYGKTKCHNVKRNFYNEENCKLSYLSTACAANTEPKKVIVLDDANLAGIRSQSSGRKLYVVTNLTLSDVYDESTGFSAPCADTNRLQWSRWIKDESDTECENVANLGDGTLKLFQDMIDSRGLVGDFNEDIVDVNRDHKLCDVSDKEKRYLGKVKSLDGTCWKHIHQSEMNVYDLTGADESMYAINGNMATIMSMEIFSSSIESNFTVVGRFGDHVEIDNNSIPSPLNNQEIQDTYMSLEYNPQGHSVLVCGSPSEIASDPFHGDNGFDVVAPEIRSKSVWELSGQKNTIWTDLTLNSKDQLRAKMAWSLSQIVSVGLPDGSESSSDFEETEERLAFYDFFVKNGFGW